MNKLNNRIYLIFILATLWEGCTTEKKEIPGKDTVQVTSESNLPELAFKKYDLRSGIITFEISGREPGSSKKVYFDDFGNKEVSYIYRNGKLSEKWVNNNDGTFYTLDYGNSTGARRKASRPGTEERFDIEEMPEEMRKENEVKSLADSIVAGKLCKFYAMESGGIKTVKGGYGHLILFLSTQVADFRYSTIATELKENVTVPDSVYLIPLHFTVKEF
ncbi:MAG TPA: hypothetical protein VNW99_03965 [Cytophagaceae bacterium]|nr:hypothetical protein [Cytophagaceae bacterium]